MADVAGSARRMLHRVLGSAEPRIPLRPGAPNAATGAEAVARVERALSGADPIPEGRNALARAMGAAMAGGRGTARLTSVELAGSLDLVGEAAATRLPVVVHVTAGNLTGTPADGGDDPLHAAGERGAMVLAAATAQEAVDFTAIARRAAEEALVPVIVGMDATLTADSVQVLRLPEDALLTAFAGDPGGILHPPTPSQELLYGKHRARVPRRHDPERPALTGAMEGTRAAALGEAGRYAYLDGDRGVLLEAALAEFGRLTGRAHPAVSGFMADDASTVFVASGGWIGALEGAARRARGAKKKVGVVGIRVLAPFPSERVAALLGKKKLAVIFEDTRPDAAIEPPLLGQVRAALAGLSSRETPAVVVVHAGLGGSPVRDADLDALIDELSRAPRSPVFLGLDFARKGSAYPKRQVLLDSLERSYPGAAALGLHATTPAPSLPEGILSVAFDRLSGRGGETVAGDAARMLFRLRGDAVRTRAGRSFDHWGSRVRDMLFAAGEPFSPPGDDAPAAIAAWLGGSLPPRDDLAQGVIPGGAVLIEREPESRSLWESLPVELRRTIKERNLTLYVTKAGTATSQEDHDERVLGAFLGVLVAEGKLDAKPRKLLAAREEMLAALPAEARAKRFTQFQAGLDGVLAVMTSELAAPDAVPAEEPRVPGVVRRLKRTDEAADSLARFWDQVGVPLERGETGELVPDPYLAAGIVPPLASSFRDLYAYADTFPGFDPARCTGCGVCWSVCPDGALSPAVMPPAGVLEAGMALARESGRSADGLRLISSRLAGALGEAAALDTESGKPARALLQEAYSRVTRKTVIPDERRPAVEEAFASVASALGDLPLARTAPFFDAPEAEKKGTGELLTLAVSVDACKGCGLCVASCEPKALTALPRDRNKAAAARAIWRTVEALPPVTPATVARARVHPEVGPVGAATLPAANRALFTGGDGAEPGSGAKTALRQVLALARENRQAALTARIEEIGALKERLGTEIREVMAKALPAGDLAALSQGLAAVERPDVNLTELSARIEGAFDTGRVDVARMRRLVQSAKDVTDLHWRLTEGEGGLGVAPFGLLFGPGAAAAWTAFPRNPFGVPVAVDRIGETPAVARGILEAELARAARDVAVLRQARLEIDNPKEAERAAEAPVTPPYREFTEEERAIAPALFVVIEERALPGGAGALAELLAGDLPVRVVAFADPLADVLDGGRADLGLLALAERRAFAAQTSTATPAHLDLAMAGAAAHAGPSLIRVLAPSPENHGFPRDGARERAAGGTASRVLPLFISRPADPGFRVDLTGNPDPGSLWTDGGAFEPFTPAHWARGEGRFTRYFGPVPGGAEPSPISEYLALDAEERAEKTPAIASVNGTPIAVDPAMVAAVEEIARRWRFLQSLAAPVAAAPAGAGEPTPAEEVEALLAKHAEEAEAMRADYEARLAEESAGMRLELARRVRGRLMTMLRRPAANGHDEEETPK